MSKDGMYKKENFSVVALGGSIIISRKIQTGYLRRLRNFTQKRIESGEKFIFVVGGGSVARNYQRAAFSIVNISNEDKDWLGIHSTRLNAHLLRTIFNGMAYPIVLDDPEKPITQRDLKKYSLFIASGWRPGWSTDYIAFRLAHRFGAKRVVVATKISNVYDADIQTHKNARPLKRISWKRYSKLLPSKIWYPGMGSPVDPVATEFAAKKKISCVVLRGTNLKNLNRFLDGKKFEGTVIN
ncbi:MAG: UMP kinase [Candidatus Spechtbacterales bacterium]